MKKIPKYISAAMAFLFIVIVFFPAQMNAAKTSANVAMEVKAGFEGVARLGTYIPYRITVINKGRAVEGEIQIEIKTDSQNRTVFSKPVSLAEGAAKEVVINASVYTARRGVQVRFTENGKTVHSMEYTFSKLIPPDIKIIGVLSSDPAAFDFLNGASIPQGGASDMEMKEKMIYASGGTAAYSTAVPVQDQLVSEVESLLLPLGLEDFPQDSKVMDGFDILIISNFDTSTLSEAQKNTLLNWVEEGGTLITGTGTNWRKVYDPLPEELKKFSVTGTTASVIPRELESYAGNSASAGRKLDIVTGELGFAYKKAQTDLFSMESINPEDGKEQVVYNESVDEVLLGDSSQPLAVKYIHQSGRVLFLAFDPGMEPVAGWEGKQAFWRNLLFHASANQNQIYQRGSGYYYSRYTDNYNVTSLASQVPDDRTPPFLFIFITIAVYIILAGPILYLFLKKKDKRDWSWIAVPVIATVCLLFLYVAGFKTRYRSAVLNTVSLILLDMENEKAEIATGMGVFNNKRGNLKLTYSQEDGIDFDVTQSEYRNYTVYSDGSEPEGKIASRLVLTEPAQYELYDVSMWEPKYLTAKKEERFEDKVLHSVQISNGTLKAVIHNTTRYDFLEAFITIGNNFVYAGDILSGQEKTIEVDLNSGEVCKGFEEYLDNRYGRYNSSSGWTAEVAEKLRKRSTIENLLQTQYYNIKDQTRVGLYALNNQDPGFRIQINDENPETYFTNAIFTNMELSFEKGIVADIPSGILLPAISETALVQNIAGTDSDSGIMVYNTGDIDFTFTLPKFLQPTEFALEFDTYLPLYVKYNIEDMKARDSNLKTRILQNRYEYYLYNNQTDQWEKIEKIHSQNVKAADYVDEENRLAVRVRVIELVNVKESQTGNEYLETERLAYPALQLKGVVQ